MAGSDPDRGPEDDPGHSSLNTFRLSAFYTPREPVEHGDRLYDYVALALVALLTHLVLTWHA